MSTPVNLQPAYVLHTRNYRESSLIVELFTCDYGRVPAVARGARRPKARMRGVLQPFRRLLVSFSGRQAMKTLLDAEDQFSTGRLQGTGLYSGLYLNELLMRLLKAEDHHSTLFNAYEHVLAEIKSGKNIEPLLRDFEQYLLRDLGYGMPFPEQLCSHEPTNSNPGQFDETVYYYSPDGHFFLLDNKPEAEQLPRCFQGKHLQAIARSDYADREVLRAAKRLMRLALHPLLGDRPLQSRTLFKH